MVALERTASSSSTSSSTLSTTTGDPTHSVDVSLSYVPYVRRRNTPYQLKVLQQYFDVNSHPTRDQRQTLANDLGMELKSVTNWFQNRRQTAKRKSLAWNENSNSPKTRPVRSSPYRSPCKKTLLKRSAISLDRIAELSERPNIPSQTTEVPRTPLTPRTINVGKNSTTPRSPLNLWKYIPSSPIVPQSSPSQEEERMAILPSQAKTFRSLEWACLKARRDKRFDDDRDELPSLPSLDHGVHFEGERTETEFDDLVAPNTSDNVARRAPHCEVHSGTRAAAQNNSLVVSKSPQSEDVEAAMTLLGFRTHF
ncbi:hypothetical protein F5I97DRAFT_1202517 [Phlebopus sp. FC_14]|nr:hypothetical protein F5I97DRAFT_1202517 [Phlebopus sp. FC_14]